MRSELALSACAVRVTERVERFVEVIQHRVDERKLSYTMLGERKRFFKLPLCLDRSRVGLYLNALRLHVSRRGQSHSVVPRRHLGP